MDKFHVAFKVLKGLKPDHMREGKVKTGLKHVRTHMVFYIKMDSKFTCKARLVAGGHNIAPSLSITYYIVMIRGELDWNY